jgi:hypothetical protein
MAKTFIESQYEHDFLLLWKWYQSHWASFASDILRVNLEPKQAQLLTLVQNNERTEATCCHAAGKTFTSVVCLLTLNALYPFSVGITTAPSFRQVEKLFWSELGRRFHSSYLPLLGYPAPNTTKWNIAPGWFATGESSDTPAKIEGFHSPTAIFYIIDEAKAVPDAFFESIEGGMNAPMSRQLRITTPGPAYGEAYECTLGKKRDMWQHLQISARDVPRLKKWADEKKAEWGEDSPIYKMRVLGQYVDEAMAKIFTAKHVRLFSENAANGTVKREGKRIIGADIARLGGDLSVLTYRVGNYIEVQEKFQGKRIDEMAVILANRMDKFNADLAVIDAINMGVGVMDILIGKGLGGKVAPFVSINTASADIYDNVKTETAFKIRLAIENGTLGGAMTQDLANDMMNYDFHITKKEKYQIVDPDDSPDFGDSLIMAFSQDASTRAYSARNDSKPVGLTERQNEAWESFSITRAREESLREALVNGKHLFKNQASIQRTERSLRTG